jgi:hypothetical protein
MAGGTRRTRRNWKQVRNRWEFFQGLRSWLLLAGFVLTRSGFAIG